MDKTDAHVVLYISLQGALLYSNCNLQNVLGICKCVEGAIFESEWPVEQGPSKGKNFEGKTLLKQPPPLCKKATQNKGKTSKVL